MDTHKLWLFYVWLRHTIPGLSPSPFWEGSTYTFLGLLLLWAPTLRFLLLLVLCLFQSPGTKVVHTERRSLVAHGWVPAYPHV